MFISCLHSEFGIHLKQTFPGVQKQGYKWAGDELYKDKGPERILPRVLQMPTTEMRKEASTGLICLDSASVGRYLHTYNGWFLELLSSEGCFGLVLI